MNGFWAETYPGSGRLTGQTTDTPTTDNHGDVVGAVWYDATQREEFEADFEWQQHDYCHQPGSYADWACPHCVAAGWVK